MNPTVLVVDDDPAILESITFIIEDAGYRVTNASDFDSALLSATSVIPDVILLDYWLPKKNGGEVAAALQSDARTRAIPVILMSASHQARKLAEKIGVTDCILKPFDMDELLATIGKYTGHSRQSLIREVSPAH